MRRNESNNHDWNRNDRSSERRSDRNGRQSQSRDRRNSRDDRSGGRERRSRKDDNSEDRDNMFQDRRRENGSQEKRGGFSGKRTYQRRDDRRNNNDDRRGGGRRFDDRRDDRRNNNDDRRGGGRRFDDRRDDRRNNNDDRRGGGRRFEGRRDDRRDDNRRRFDRGDERREERFSERTGRRHIDARKYTSRKKDDYQTKAEDFENIPIQKESSKEKMRLNKYISNAGICSRREADVLITTGVISVNGEIITELGYKVSPDDIVKYDGRTLKNEKKVYILLNKPKDFITTSDDPQNRRTVMALIDDACKERVYPVGRLDRNTTGLLLFTNDGELTKKLTHPSFGAAKVYNVELDKAINKEDMEKLLNGVELEDGLANVDNISYTNCNPPDKKKVGVSIHSGKNRIIRRMFEAIGYDVVKLDRVYFAGLTKKNLLRGKYRFLSEQEVAFLKMNK